MERSETSDNRPYITTSTTEIHTTPHNTNIQIQESNELLSDASESQLQHPQQSPQRTQPITQQPPIAHFENLSLQIDEHQNNDNNQDELQNPNPTLDTQSTDLTVNSYALVVPIRPIEEQDLPDNTEQDLQFLIQGSSTLSTTTTIPQYQYLDIMIHHPYLNLIHTLPLLHPNSQVPLITISMVL